MKGLRFETASREQKKESGKMHQIRVETFSTDALLHYFFNTNIDLQVWQIAFWDLFSNWNICPHSAGVNFPTLAVAD